MIDLRNKHRPLSLLALVLGFSVLCTQQIFAQDSTRATADSFHQQDLKDWLVQKKILKPKPPKNSFLLIVPVIASNPSAGFIFGGGLSYVLKTRTAITRLSSISANATYSTKGQLNLNVKSNMFVLKDKLVLNGDWRFQVFSEDTYGLGTNRKQYSNGDFVNGINGVQTNEDSVAQLLKYNLIRFHETGSWNLFPNFFAGIGFQFDEYSAIKDAAFDNGDSNRAFHYQYSKANGFNADKYNVAGWCLNLLYDSRDNQVNAYKGYYANVNYSLNSKVFGSTQSSQLLLVEYRSFHALDGNKQRNILSFWLYGNVVTNGKVPYLYLPALGYDQRQKTGRGYPFGRFRGEGMMYGESEYRFPISKRTGILGGVVFANVTSTSDKSNDVKLMQYLRPGYGAGLRVMVDKQSRTRLNIDAAVGNGKLGFYFGALETF